MPLCRCKCPEKVSHQEVYSFNKNYWSMSEEKRRLWLRSMLVVVPKSRSRSRVRSDGEMGDEQSNYERQSTIKWCVPTQNEVMNVCKSFFMTAIGMLPNSDKFIRNAIMNGDSCSLEPTHSQRGRHTPSNKKNEYLMKEHILSFSPCEPHYRRAHAPYRRYLPAGLSCAQMHKDYNEAHPNQKVSYDTYRRILKSENIGFTLLGHEECETCTKKAHHMKSSTETDHTTCEICIKHESHQKRFQEARAAYRKDANRSWRKDEIIASVDLMKVFLLPSLPHKICMFTSRLISFNLTFALLKPSKENAKEARRDSNVGASEKAILWHEACAGRDGEDIVSAYWSWLLEQRDKRYITLYADNCTAQNKQWALFTCLLFAVNSDFITARAIQMKFLESGHTFMSADSVHHKCEMALRHKQVADFADFEKEISTTVKTKTLSHVDFADWPNGVSRHKMNQFEDKPRMSDIVVACFRRGSKEMLFKYSHTDEEFRGYSLLKRNFEFTNLPPPARKLPRGINTDKKNGIVDNLIPLIPASRRPFWQSLPTRNVGDMCSSRPRV